MWQKVAKFKGAEYFRKALYLWTMTLSLLGWELLKAAPKRLEFSISTLRLGSDVLSP